MYNIHNLATIYVSQKYGADSNQGFFAENNDLLQGPVKSVEKALFYISEMRKFDALQPITICILDDIYYVDKPIVIDENIGYVTIESKGKTLLSGGLKIDCFREDTFNGVPCVSADLSNYPTLNFSDCYINGKRAKVTRYPDNGVLLPVEVEEKSSELHMGSKWFIAKKEDMEVIKTFKNIQNCIVSFNHYWVDEHSPIKEICEDSGKITLEYRSQFTIEPTHDASALRYIIENVSENFKNPGEWYFDFENHKLYYIPEDKDIDVKDIVAFVPVTDKIFSICGKKGQKVKNITIRNFDIAYTKGDSQSYKILEDTNEKIEIASDIQSVCDGIATVQFENAYNCEIKNCNIYCTGIHAIRLNTGCEKVRIQDNKITEIGAGGIVIFGANCDADKDDYSFGNTIFNNEISNGGKRYYAGCGILLNHTYENIISHNEISNFSYTGISCGWVWGYTESITHDNIIEYNHIHHLGGGVLSDMGGVYLLGKQRGTIVRNNHIHDVCSCHYGGWALYADEGCSYVAFENNLCYNTNSNSFQQHFGSANVVRNNIFAYSKDEPLGMSRPEMHLGTVFERNIVVTDGQPAIQVGYKGEDSGCLQIISLSNNIYYDLKNTEPTMVKIGKKVYSFKEYKEKLQIDTDSVCMNPKFKDIKNFDFTLEENSPAIKMGFVPIDLENVGLIK